MIEKEFLIIGADDSNHASDSRIKGEIDVATFSFNSKDREVREFKNRRSYASTMSWLGDSTHDYRFILLQSEVYRSRRDNLILVVPFLTESFLETNNIRARNLECYLDGFVSEDEKRRLANALKKIDGVEEIIIKGFIKKHKTNGGGFSKRPTCPSVIYHADVLANYLFPQPYSGLVSNPKLVKIL